MAAKADELLGLFQSGLTKLAASFNIVTGAVQSFGNTLGQFVQLFNPAVVNQFTFAVRDLMATIGQALTPVLRAAIPVVRFLGDLFDGVRQAVEPLISQGLAVLAPILSQLGQVIQQLVGQSLTTMIPVWRTIMTVVGQVVQALMPFVNILVRNVGILQSFQAVFMQAFLIPLRFFLPLLTMLAGIFETIVTPVQEFAMLLGQLAGALADLAGEFAGVLGTLFADLVGILIGPLVTGIRYVVNWLREMVDVLHTFFGLQRPEAVELGNSRGKALAQTGTSDVKGLLTKFQTSAFALGGADDPQQQVARNTGEANGMLGEIRKYLSEGLPKDIEAMAGRVANGVLDGLGRLAEQATARLNPLNAADIFARPFR